MKTVGLIGAASWQETSAYLEAIHSAIAGSFGREHTPKILLQTFDSAHIALLAGQSKWPMLADKMARAARNLQDAGANCVALCGLGMHAAAGEIENSVRIPFLHALDPVAVEVQRLGLREVGLLYDGSPHEERYLRTELSLRLGPHLPVRFGSHADAVIVGYDRCGFFPAAPPGITVLGALAIHARAIANYSLEAPESLHLSG